MVVANVSLDPDTFSESLRQNRLAKHFTDVPVLGHGIFSESPVLIRIPKIGIKVPKTWKKLQLPFGVLKEEGDPVQILLKTWSKNLSRQCVQIIKIVPLGVLLHPLPLIPVLINGAGRCFMVCDLGSEAVLAVEGGRGVED